MKKWWNISPTLPPSYPGAKSLGRARGEGAIRFFFYYYYSYYFERQLQQLLPSRVAAAAAARFISLHKSSTFGGKWQRPQSRQNCVDDFLATSTIMGTSQSCCFFIYIHTGNYQGREMTVFVFVFFCYSIFRRVRVRVLNCQWRRYDL